jgi:hypothetical protein
MYANELKMKAKKETTCCAWAFSFPNGSKNDEVAVSEHVSTSRLETVLTWVYNRLKKLTKVFELCHGSHYVPPNANALIEICMLSSCHETRRRFSLGIGGS